MASAKDLSGSGSSGGDGSGVWALLPRDASGTLAPASYPNNYRQRPEILSAKPTASGLWHSMRRRLGMAVGLGLLTALLVAALVWLFVPVRYEAYAIVRVAASMPSVISTSQPTIDFENYKRSQAVAIKTPKVLYAALQQPEISGLPIIKRQADPASWLADKLLLDFPQNGEFLRVALRGDEKTQLAPVVNAVVKAYMVEVVDKENAKVRERRDLLEKKVGEYQESVRKSKERLQSLADNAQTNDSETARNTALRERLTYETLNKKCGDLESRIVQIDLDMKATEVLAKNARSLPDEFIDVEVSKDPRIIKLETDIAGKQAQLSELRNLVRNPDRDPGIQSLSASIGAMLSQVEDRKQEVRTIMMQTGRGGDSPQQKLQSLQAQRDIFVKLLEETRKQADDKFAELNKLTVYSAEIETQKSANKVTEDLATQLLSAYELAKIEATTPPRIAVYDNAEEPKENDAFRKYLMMAFGSTLGFGLVVLGVSRLEFQSRRLNSAEEITEGLGLRLMGDLPPLNRSRGLSFRSTPSAILQGMVAESIDSIRMALIHDAAVEGSRVVMITSANEGEGKTTVACNLAASLARSGRRTLLIDGNLRNPSAHQMFNLPLEPGFCEVLRGETDVDGATVPTEVEGLFVLPAGYCDGLSLQALAKNAAREVFDRLRTQYEFILIDGAPVLTVADALSFARYTDGAILSARRDVSQIPKVYEASERLKSVGLNVTGVVVNGVQDRPSRTMYTMSLSADNTNS